MSCPGMTMPASRPISVDTIRGDHRTDRPPARRAADEAARERAARARRPDRGCPALLRPDMTSATRATAVIVGGGFAGVACARKLAAHPDLHVTLIDRNDYHQFQPLLYQVATSMLAAADIAYPLRKIAAEYDGFETKRAEVVAIDPVARTVTTRRGETYTGDYIVLAAGSQPNFFGTPGAEHAFPLYSLDDADRLKTRIIQAFEEADSDPRLVDEGALHFVVVGGGPTGVEVAGALSEMIRTTMMHEFTSLAPRAKVHLVDHGTVLLKMFAGQGPRLRGTDPREGRRRPSPGDRREGDRSRSRHPVGRLDDQDALRHLGRRPDGCAGGRGERVAPGPRRPDRRRPGLHRRRVPGRPGHRRHRQHPGQGRQDPPAARLGRAPERLVGRQDHPRRPGAARTRSRSPISTRGPWR